MKKRAKRRQKRFVIVYGEDMFEGDSAFYCPGPDIKYKDGMTLEDIRKKWIEMTAVGCEESEKEEIALEATDIIGAWVVDEKGLNACNAVWESDPGNDSAVYNCNMASKHVASQVCVKEIKCTKGEK